MPIKNPLFLKMFCVKHQILAESLSYKDSKLISLMSHDCDS